MNSTIGTLKNLLIIVCVVFAISISFLSLYFMYYYKTSMSTVWVFDSKTGNVSHAQANDALSNKDREIMYMAHIRQFIKIWFSYDQYSFKTNVNEGLYLLGNCGKIMYDDYKRQDVLRKLQEYNMTVLVQIDSLKLDLQHKPMRGIVFCKQSFIHANGNAKMNMVATFDLIDLAARSDKNPSGVLLDNFKIIDNSAFVSSVKE